MELEFVGVSLGVQDGQQSQTWTFVRSLQNVLYAMDMHGI